jgi:hypothetical protein
MKFQRMLSNGKWTDEDRIDLFINKFLAREPIMAPRQNRKPMTTSEQVIEFISAGNKAHYDDDWYADFRDADAIIPQAPRRVNMVRCDCGHECPSTQRMNASRGTSCPDCYDRMSDY